MKKIPKKNDKVINISSGWKGVVIDTNSKEDSSLVKYSHNPKREPDWIANNDLKVESKTIKKLQLKHMIKEVNEETFWKKSIPHLNALLSLAREARAKQKISFKFYNDIESKIHDLEKDFDDF